MRICHIAVHEQNAGWGAETFLAKGFEALGHEVIRIDYRNDRRPTIPDCDTILLQRGDALPTSIIGAANRPAFLWATELTSRQPDQERLFEWGGWDHVFVHSDECMEIAKRYNDNVSILHAGFDSDTHRPSGAERDIDVLHIGTMTPRRKAILDKLPMVTVETAYGKEMAALFSRAKIVLNLHATDRIDLETRIFEAMGCGAMVITEPLPSYSPFRQDHELFEAPADIIPKAIDTFLRRDDLRQLTANIGHAEAMRNHTYYARAKQIVAIMEDEP